MKRSILIAAAIAAAPLTSVFAANRTWTGAGDGISWTDVNNWDGAIVIPSDGDTLSFPDVASGQFIDPISNRVLGPTTFNAPDAYTVTGTSATTLTLGGSLVQNGAGPVTLNAAISTGGNPQSFSAGGAGVVNFGGVVSGAGLLSFNSGNWRLSSAANSFSGGLTVNTGAFLEATGTPAPPTLQWPTPPPHISAGPSAATSSSMAAPSS